ncbi:hypothetical protein QE152_g37326 [Popillia japonica]|uniref:Uncharacterized protein n=1 Tax=Popillia japonica TaxID=7064 RepID=A0AAW1IAG4_POPJA
MIRDVRSFRGANADSDHILVIANMNLRKIEGKLKKTIRINWKVQELNTEETRRKYEEQLNQQLVKRKETNNIEAEWINIKEIPTVLLLNNSTKIQIKYCKGLISIIYQDDC